MSTRITTSMTQRHVLADLNGVTDRLSRTQRKLASNREIERPSDDPFGASRALALRESLGGIRQHQRNVEDARGWQEATELSLARMTDAVHRARELLTRGSSDSTDQVSRNAIADEIDELIETVRENANATYKGQQLFSGTATDTQPYPTSTDAYQGDAAVIAREVGPGVALTINVRGDEVLGSGQGAADNKLLHVLRDVADHLRAGDSASLRGADLSRLGTNLEQLLETRAVNGARSNRLELALSRLQELDENTLTQLSETEDADMAKTLIDLNSQQAAYQAALRAGANIMQSSLMDFLR